MSMNQWSDDSDSGKQMYSVKTCPNIILSEKNPTYICPGLNPGVRSDSIMAEGLSNGAATLLSNKRVGFHNPTLSSLTYVYYDSRGHTSEDVNPNAPSLPSDYKSLSKHLLYRGS